MGITLTLVESTLPSCTGLTSLAGSTPPSIVVLLLRLLKVLLKTSILHKAKAMEIVVETEGGQIRNIEDTRSEKNERQNEKQDGTARTRGDKSCHIISYLSINRFE
jgi:hypothetical protein